MLVVQPVVDRFEWIEIAIERQHNFWVHVGRFVATERKKTRTYA